jgi:Nucleotidyl transferase AbiEii toxin, Type IV TA system
MLSADVLTFREFMMAEPLPLATLHQAVLEFLRGRDDVVLFGAQAVNAYVDEPRMTQDLDLLSTDAEGVALALRDRLQQRFRIAVRVRRVSEGRGFRVFQVRKTGNRHLVDLRRVETLPRAERIAGVLVMAPAALIASKVLAYQHRRGQPKSGTDWRDLAMLLLTFPDLKRDPGPVVDQLHTAGATPEALTLWHELVVQEIRPAKDEDF